MRLQHLLLSAIVLAQTVSGSQPAVQSDIQPEVELFSDDFTRFSPGMLSAPIGLLNGAIQEYHYIEHRGVPTHPWRNPIVHLDTWAAGDDADGPYLEQHTVGERPVTDEELQTAKDSLIQRLPGSFASVSAINGALTTLWSQGLPDDYYQQYTKAVAAVTKSAVLRVAKKHIDIDHLAIVIVGDQKSIEAPLKATNIAPIAYLDIEGAPKTQ